MEAVLEKRAEAGGAPYIVGPDGGRHPLSGAQYRLVMMALYPGDRAATGGGERVGTGEAAQILGVSRRTIARMLDAGRIPSERNGEGGHRTALLSDVLAYRDRMASRRERLLDARDAMEALGLYD